MCRRQVARCNLLPVLIEISFVAGAVIDYGVALEVVRRQIHAVEGVAIAELEIVGVIAKIDNGVVAASRSILPEKTSLRNNFRQLEVDLDLRLGVDEVARVNGLRSIGFDVGRRLKDAERGIVHVGSIDEKRGLAVLRHLEVAELGRSRAARERMERRRVERFYHL